MNPLRSIVEAGNLEGKVLAGAGPADIPAIQNKLSVTSKIWCAVSSWIVVDVTCLAQGFLPYPVLPLVLYAQNVVAGDDDRLQAGDTILSTYATGYNHGAIFETPDRVYILMGAGHRVSADLQLVQAAQSHFVRSV
ncbi:hypothetical protein GIW45_26615 [Pseudomonas congelans]|uniref:DUF6957 family protein n=1 Tax=Pseudomonas congelans TaxID=200452 RepID=UPI001F3EECBF|nr:hypothetical protein [Pseudomonas congelans]MCF5167509.1 hypothetical protein [Pseudomonas congelans]